MNKLVLLILLAFTFSSYAQNITECLESRTYQGTKVEVCETKQVIIGFQEDTIILFYQNAYQSDTVICEKVCKVNHPAVVIKDTIFVPIYGTIKTCRVEATGDKVRQVFVDCPEF